MPIISFVKVPFTNIPAQYMEVKDKVDQSISEILSTGAYVLGKYGSELEQTIAQRHGVKHGIAVNSGTDALRILIQASGILPGDEIISTAFTFVASIEVMVQVGVKPVFVDIEEEHMCIDPAKIEAAITPRTKAIMPVHLFGQLANMTEIKRIADKHGLMILEDAAQSLYAHHNGQYCCTYGHGGGISFYVTKNLGAIGDGGMILTNDDEVARRSKSLRIHGMGRERYYYDEIGYTSRLAEIQSAPLVHKLARLDDWNARRAEIAGIYQSILAGSKARVPKAAEGNNHTWHQFTILHDDRDGLMAHLKENEVDSAIFYPVPIHLHAPYAEFGHGAGSLPVTESVSKRCLSLPVHQHLSNEQVEFAANLVKNY